MNHHGIMTMNLPQARPPTRLATMLEARAPLDWATVLLRAPQLVSAPRGDGRPIVLLPGYGSDEISMRPLRKYLEFLGYDVHEWGIGRNRGKVEDYVQRIGKLTGEIQRQRGDRVTLIGWSLGGIVARETARLFESSVREVITMGTPIVGGPKYTAVAERFAEQSGIDLDAFELEVHERNSIGLKQPINRHLQQVRRRRWLAGLHRRLQRTCKEYPGREFAFRDGCERSCLAADCRYACRRWSLTTVAGKPAPSDRGSRQSSLP